MHSDTSHLNFRLFASVADSVIVNSLIMIQPSSNTLLNNILNDLAVNSSITSFSLLILSYFNNIFWCILIYQLFFDELVPRNISYNIINSHMFHPQHMYYHLNPPNIQDEQDFINTSPYIFLFHHKSCQLFIPNSWRLFQSIQSFL